MTFPYSSNPDVTCQTERKEVLEKIFQWVMNLPDDVEINLAGCPNWTIPYLMTILIRLQKQRSHANHIVRGTA